jgi:hypothetical protein
MEHFNLLLSAGSFLRFHRIVRFYSIIIQHRLLCPCLVRFSFCIDNDSLLIWPDYAACTVLQAERSH